MCDMLGFLAFCDCSRPEKIVLFLLALSHLMAVAALTSFFFAFFRMQSETLIWHILSSVVENHFLQFFGFGM